VVAVALSFFFVKDQLAEAIFLDVSGYDMASIQADSNIQYLLHQSFNAIAVIPCAFGIAVFASGDNGRFVRGAATRFNGFLYAAALVCLFGFGMLMGNKNELFGGMIMGVTFFLINSPRPPLVRMSLWGSLSLVFIAVIDFTRSMSLSNLTSDFSWAKAGGSIVGIVSSNEAFAAHFSMYGVLHHNVALTWGTSLQSLIASFVPRMFWPNRPETIYTHYVEGVGALAGQGYTIHHATGWYLNFGLAGVIFGAALFGAIWSGLYRGMQLESTSSRPWRRVIFSVSFAAVTGSLPILLRNGLEVYKPIIIYALILPVVIIWWSSWRVDNQQGVGVIDA